jgi:hypothetical protein
VPIEDASRCGDSRAIAELGRPPVLAIAELDEYLLIGEKEGEEGGDLVLPFEGEVPDRQFGQWPISDVWFRQQHVAQRIQPRKARPGVIKTTFGRVCSVGCSFMRGATSMTFTGLRGGSLAA